MHGLLEHNFQPKLHLKKLIQAFVDLCMEQFAIMAVTYT